MFIGELIQAAHTLARINIQDTFEHSKSYYTYVIQMAVVNNAVLCYIVYAHVVGLKSAESVFLERQLAETLTSLQASMSEDKQGTRIEQSISRSVDAAVSSGSSKGKGTTGISVNKSKYKHPVRYIKYLQQTQSSSGSGEGRTRYLQNRFGKPAKYFFYPVLQLVSTLISKCKSKGRTKGANKSVSTSHTQPTTPTADPTISIEGLLQSVKLGDELSAEPENEIGLRSAEQPLKSGGWDMSDDDVEAVILAQSVVALGAFVRCSLNTIIQRYLLVSTVTVLLPSILHIFMLYYM